MTVAVYDFRQPAPLATGPEQGLTAWLGAACTLAAGRWGKELGFAAGVYVKGREVQTGRTALASVPEGQMGFRVTLGPGVPPSLVVLPRALVLALLGGLMGETVSTLPEDRALTTVEESLCDYLVDALLLDCFRKSWPGEKAPDLTLGGGEPDPRAARLFAPEEPVLRCRFTVSGPFGEPEWFWLLPRSDWLAGLGPARAAAPAAPPAGQRERLEGLARDFPVEVAVSLGTAEISLTQLSRLRPGDLVVLDQRVSQPLRATVGGADKFHVWPGALGPRQAVAIESNLG